MQVAVLGYGTVGSGVVEVLDVNASEIAARLGEPLELKYILDLRDFPGDPHEAQVVHDVAEILNDADVKLVCETMGGMEPAFTFTKQALSAGKSVCTSNKELVAAHGPELLRIAKEHDCSYLFEASVGGGIPILRTLRLSLTAEKIDAITGILNGTTNYILTRMNEKDGGEMTEMLAEAQAKGYAEQNPAADIEGYDACRKIAILSSLMTGQNVTYTDIHTEGITKLSLADYAYAGALSCTIKLLAYCRQTAAGLEAIVAPFMLSMENPLAFVSGVYNAVLVHGNMLGDSMYYGQGAGKEATASAVVADLIECAHSVGANIAVNWEEKNVSIVDNSSIKRRFFVRTNAADKEKANNAFAVEKYVDAGFSGETGFVTSPMTEQAFADALEKFGAAISWIRVYDAV